MRWIACVITLFAGLTMVSNVPFYSFKDINCAAACRSGRSCWSCSRMILISTNPPMVLFLLFVAYSLVRLRDAGC